jgi:hypothetical protein
MTNNGIVKIHGKDYMTVARRVELAHENNEKVLSITSELISTDPVLFKATVVTPKGTYTGYSASYSDPKKLIEKQSPYEVAETSAVGRALGFAGYGVVESIASADEMVKSEKVTSTDDPNIEFLNQEDAKDSEPKDMVCSTCGEPAKLKSGISSKTNKPYAGIFCSSDIKSHTIWR